MKPSSEATLAYYWQFLEPSKDAEFIETLFFTSLKQAEELIPVLNGLLLKELNARYSQKIADELIKAEESEKMGRKKKKKPAKTILKSLRKDCAYCPRNTPCEIFSFSRQFASQITRNAIKASLFDTFPEETAESLRRSEYETSISVVSDTTRKCHFPSILVKKNRCTSNSREKGLKPTEDPSNRYLAQSEITTLLDSNTDFESVADSLYGGSLKKSSKMKGFEPIFDNKKPRNLSHEKYEQASDQKIGSKIEEKKALECEDFIEVKRKRSVKDTVSYITSSACKPSLKGAGKKIAEKKTKGKEKIGGNSNKHMNSSNYSCKSINSIADIPMKNSMNNARNIGNCDKNNSSGNANGLEKKITPHKEEKVNKNALMEKKLSKEISTFIDGMRPKIEEIRVYRAVGLKRLRFILASLFPRKIYVFSLIFI